MAESDESLLLPTLNLNVRMNISGILSIAGKPGLYKMVGQMKNGIIVESIDTGKRFPAYASHKVSALEDITIYSQDNDVPLGEVFERIYKAEKGKTTIDPNSSGAELKAKMEAVFPEYDEERVYTSDLKKVFKWYNLLVENDLLKLDDDSEATDENSKEEQSGAENQDSTEQAGSGEEEEE
jgi:hypothetical protein